MRRRFGRLVPILQQSGSVWLRATCPDYHIEYPTTTSDESRIKPVQLLLVCVEMQTSASSTIAPKYVRDMVQVDFCRVSKNFSHILQSRKWYSILCTLSWRTYPGNAWLTIHAACPRPLQGPQGYWQLERGRSGVSEVGQAVVIETNHRAPVSLAL